MTGGVSPEYASNREFLDALDEVHTRFVLNLPDSELESADRIFFQLEQAWWFYEDWICDQRTAAVADAAAAAANDATAQSATATALPRFSTFKPFALELFGYSPLLPSAKKRFVPMWNQFSLYKRKISNYGCILLNSDCTKIVLCQLWNSNTHTLPAGKINQGENGMAAAARETYEETGFDPLLQFGLTEEWKASAPSNITWTPLREQDSLVFQDDNGKRRTCFICHGVPENFPFEPVARKEVSVVAWHPIDDLPKKSYAVIPFVKQLKKWIHRKQKQRQQKNKNKTPNRDRKNKNKTPLKPGSSRGQSTPSSRAGSRGRDSVISEDDDLVTSGLADVGEIGGWSEEDMFKANERLIGRKVEYDGNPHLFAERGFDGQQDPHAFHVVGGTFLNATDGTVLAPANPDTSKLQPLFRKEQAGSDDADGFNLTPFFSTDSTTLWGEAVPGDLADPNSAASDRKQKKRQQGRKDLQKDTNPGQVLLKQLQRSTTDASDAMGAPGDDSVFMTDAEVTAKSQAAKAAALAAVADASARRKEHRREYEEDMEYVRQWVAKLPKPGPTKLFGDFKLNADAILAEAERRVRESAS